MVLRRRKNPVNVFLVAWMLSISLSLSLSRFDFRRKEKKNKWSFVVVWKKLSLRKKLLS